MTFLFDTNHAIAHLNGDPRIAAQLASHRATGSVFAISATVPGELYYGAYASQRTAHNLTALGALLAQVALYDFDAPAADEFGKIKAEQRAKGEANPDGGCPDCGSRPPAWTDDPDGRCSLPVRRRREHGQLAHISQPTRITGS